MKNANYYASKDIKLAEVHLLLPKAGTANPTAAFVNKEVDWVGGGGEVQLDYTLMNYNSSRLVHGAPYATNYYYMFNLKQAPFSNLKIRKALAMALDRESLYGNPAYGFIPPAIHGGKRSFRSEVSDQAYFTEDAAAAKGLLAEGLREEGLSKLPSFSVIMNEGEGHENIANRVLAQWKNKLGIDVNVELQSWPELLENRRSQNFAMARAGWGADFNDPAAMLELFTSRQILRSVCKFMPKQKKC